MICKECGENGYTPRDYHRHYCTSCEKHLGNLKFDKQDLENSKKPGRSGNMQCKDCKDKLQCGACLKFFEKKCWSAAEMKDHKRRHTSLVCAACRTKGCTAKDLAVYACRTCGEVFGASKFNAKAVNNFKYNERRQPACKTCEEAEAGRLKRLQNELRKSKVFCNCSCHMHTERCRLSPRYFGERRWPGSDGFITADDRKFLDQLKPKPVWWSKAWCKQ